MIKFANNDRTLLCCSSVDASLSICDVSLQPPKVVTMLKGHQQTVTSKLSRVIYRFCYKLYVIDQALIGQSTMI